MMTATCDTCPFRAGYQCRRNPPGAGVGVAKVWPVIDLADWCGEHPARRALEITQSEQAPRGPVMRPAPAKRGRKGGR